MTEQKALPPADQPADGEEIPGVTRDIPDGPGSMQGEDEFSLLHVLSEALATRVKALDPELFMTTEPQLKALANPTPNDYALRIAFWREYDKVMFSNGKRKILAVNVFGGIVTDQYFYSKFLLNPRKLAWMIRPFQKYEAAMESLLARGRERLQELLEIKIYDRRGRLDPKAGDLVLRTVAQIENRVKGMAVTKVQGRQVHQHAHAHVTVPTVSDHPTERTVSKAVISDFELDAQLRQLDADIKSEEISLDAAADRARAEVSDARAAPPAQGSAGS